jgi:hypothetical protein
MSDEFITVRLRRAHAQFLEVNLALMADRTRAAMRSGDLAEERRAGLYQRAILLEHLDDALRLALLNYAPRGGFRSEPSWSDGAHSSVPDADQYQSFAGGGHSRHFHPVQQATAITATIALAARDQHAATTEIAREL